MGCSYLREVEKACYCMLTDFCYCRWTSYAFRLNIFVLSSFVSDFVCAMLWNMRVLLMHTFNCCCSSVSKKRLVSCVQTELQFVYPYIIHRKWLWLVACSYPVCPLLYPVLFLHYQPWFCGVGLIISKCSTDNHFCNAQYYSCSVLFCVWVHKDFLFCFLISFFSGQRKFLPKQTPFYKPVLCCMVSGSHLARKWHFFSSEVWKYLRIFKMRETAKVELGELQKL